MHPLSLLPALLPLTSVFLSTLLSAPAPAWAGSQKIGQNCSTADSKLLEGTYAFYDDCDTHAYCNDTTKLCANKECRHDIFPFGYNTSEHLPPLCDHGEFCPDEQSFCIAQLQVGEQCQLNRDGACGVRTGVNGRLTSFLVQTNVRRRTTGNSLRTRLAAGSTRTARSA
jgi:hypothetical protein